MKILFESQPKHYVTAALFLPDAGKHKAPYPGVFVPCGHFSNGKAMRAPTPVLICATTEDACADINRTWSTFRNAKRLYNRLGFAEHIDLVEYDGKHGYHQPLREASTRWMMRWLLGIDKPINVVHGALLVYDLDDLARMSGSKLTIEQPVNAWGDFVAFQ